MQIWMILGGSDVGDFNDPDVDVSTHLIDDHEDQSFHDDSRAQFSMDHKCCASNGMTPFDHPDDDAMENLPGSPINPNMNPT